MVEKGQDDPVQTFSTIVPSPFLRYVLSLSLSLRDEHGDGKESIAQGCRHEPFYEMRFSCFQKAL